MNSGKVLLGVLAGIAAGAMLGILFAPEKGSKTRKQILDKGEDYADELKHRFDELIDSITQKYHTARREAEEMVSKGKAKFEEAKNEARHEAGNAST